MLCSNCEQQNNEGAKFCSNCGRSMTASRKKKSKKRNFLYIFILLFLLSGTGFAAAQFMGDEPETAAPPVEEPAVEEEE
ncbi:MAG TPA: zinc-ribbon domain-containing protein, partial [Planococcus sp. (in: firmicutes)]|nr:zinc-ribbon domain-containing protein [Planococcus sp. (in: firmicutes)]